MPFGYRLPLSSVVFEFGGGGGGVKGPSARNRTFQSPPGIGLKPGNEVYALAAFCFFNALFRYALLSEKPAH